LTDDSKYVYCSTVLFCPQPTSYILAKHNQSHFTTGKSFLPTSIQVKVLFISLTCFLCLCSSFKCLFLRVRVDVQFPEPSQDFSCQLFSGVPI